MLKTFEPVKDNLKKALLLPVAIIIPIISVLFVLFCFTMFFPVLGVLFFDPSAIKTILWDIPQDMFVKIINGDIKKVFE